MAPDQGNLIPGASHMSPPPTHHHQGFSTNQPHHATARSINTQAWQYPHPSASTPRPSMLGPPGTPQSSPLLGQHFRGYPMNQPYHAAAPSTPTSAYGYSPTNAFVPPPFNVRPQQPYHGRHASVAAFSGTGYGAHPAAVSGIQHPQAFTIGGESASGSPPKKIMKHLTCFYWNTYGNCKYAESNCLYSHTHEGTNGVAEAPVQKQPGMPAVAGKNAGKDNPIYHDWTPNRGVIAPRHGRAKPPIGPTMEKEEVDKDKDDNKRIKLEADDVTRSSSAPPEPNPHSLQRQAEDQNQLLRVAVQDLSQVIASLFGGRVAEVSAQNEACERLVTEISTIPKDDQARLFKPLAAITRSIKKAATSEVEAKKVLDGVREKLVSAGLGGLMTALDKEFCLSGLEESRGT